MLELGETTLFVALQASGDPLLLFSLQSPLLLPLPLMLLRRRLYGDDSTQSLLLEAIQNLLSLPWEWGRSRKCWLSGNIHWRS